MGVGRRRGGSREEEGWELMLIVNYKPLDIQSSLYVVTIIGLCVVIMCGHYVWSSYWCQLYSYCNVIMLSLFLKLDPT